jgi:hypothetical protein
MTVRDAKPKKSGPLAFLRRVIAPRDTGFRDLFVEVPSDQLPVPRTQDKLREESFRRALADLRESLRDDDLNRANERFREGLRRVAGSMSEVDDAERDSQLVDVVEQVVWMMERRLQQLMLLRGCVKHHCPRGQAARIFEESTWPGPASFSSGAARCGGGEHVYQVGESRCDCGAVVVRAASATR